MREMPVTHYPRNFGAPTGAALRVIWRAFRELPRVWKYRRAALAELAAPAPSPSPLSESAATPLLFPPRRSKFPSKHGGESVGAR
jgi:hypothetical protein